MLTLRVLGSGSGGNAAVVSCGDTHILLDCGFSARETARRMTGAGLDADRVAAILVTHEHADHISGVPVFARRHRVPVFASAGTLACIRGERGCELELVAAGRPFAVGAVRVTAFATSHDCSQPLGYTFEAPDGTRVGIATDTGVVTGELLEALAGCRLIGLEVNHDVRMLETGPYPLFLRRRIASDRGHLSNAAAADALERLAHDGLHAVVGMHVSRQNNLPRLARAAIAGRLERLGLTDVGVEVAVQDEALPEVPAA